MKRISYLLLVTFLSVQIAQAQDQLVNPDVSAQITQPQLTLTNNNTEGTNQPTAFNRIIECAAITTATEFTADGILINPKFALKNAAKKTLRATAYFYYAEDTPMPAFYKGYSTSDFHLATWKDFEFCEDDLLVGDNGASLSLFLPYSKMGLNRDILNLKYFVAIFDGDEKIQESDWIYFKLNTPEFLVENK
jgi:hypothetical protein